MSSIAARAAFPLILAGGLAGCASSMSEPESVAVSDEIKTSAVVQTVDMDTRQILLRSDDGALETIVAGPEVRNLAQLEPGDRVVAVYQRSVAAQMAPAGAEMGTTSASAAAVADEGQKPGMVAADDMVAVVSFVSYDPATHVARVSDADGFVHAIEVQEPELRTFAANLKAGDLIEVTFSEAVAVGVQELNG